MGKLRRLSYFLDYGSWKEKVFTFLSKFSADAFYHVIYRREEGQNVTEGDVFVSRGGGAASVEVLVYSVLLLTGLLKGILPVCLSRQKLLLFCL